MNAGEGTTIIGKSMKISGDVSGSEDLAIEGELQGSLRLQGSRLTIGAAGRVRGDIAAKDVIVLGRVDGDIRATGRVELRASAIMQGNIYAGTFSIEESAAFRGQIDPSRAGEPIPEPGSRPSSYTLPDVHSSSPDMNANVEDKGQFAPLFAETEA